MFLYPTRQPSIHPVFGEPKWSPQPLARGNRSPSAFPGPFIVIRTRSSNSQRPWVGWAVAGERALRRPPIQWSRLDTTLMTSATITAPNKYESKAWERAVLRMALLVRFVSDTWNVIPMVNAR